MRTQNSEFALNYDEAADAAYIQLREIEPGGVKRSYGYFDKVPPWLVLDLDAEGRLIGIEILTARSRLPVELLSP